MPDKIQVRRDSAADWTTANPVLDAGEPGLESDTGKLKVGNGVSAWAALPYAANTPAEVTTALASKASSTLLADKPQAEEALSAESLFITQAFKGPISTDSTHLIFVVPFPVEVRQIVVATDVTIASAASPYWSYRLVRYRRGSATDIASISPSGEDVFANYGVRFNHDVFHATAKKLTTLDVLRLRTIPVNTPADINDLTVTVRLERI